MKIISSACNFRQASITSRDAVNEYISFWEQIANYYLIRIRPLLSALIPYHLFQKTSRSVLLGSVVCVHGRIVSDRRQHRAETITKCDLEPEKWKQERFISVERLSNTVINATNLVSEHVFVVYLTASLYEQKCVCTTSARQENGVSRLGRFWIWALLQNNRTEKLGKFDKSKSYTRVIKDAPTRRLA